MTCRGLIAPFPFGIPHEIVLLLFSKTLQSTHCERVRSYMRGA